MGEYIMKRTADWTEKFKIVGDVRGRGLMIGIEIVRDQKTKEKAPDLRNKPGADGVSQRTAGPRLGRHNSAPLPAAPDRRRAGRLRARHARRLHHRTRAQLVANAEKSRRDAGGTEVQLGRQYALDLSRLLHLFVHSIGVQIPQPYHAKDKSIRRRLAGSF